MSLYMYFFASLQKKRAVAHTYCVIDNRKKNPPHVLEGNGVGHDDFESPIFLRVGFSALVLKVLAPLRHLVDQRLDRAVERLGVV